MIETEEIYVNVLVYVYVNVKARVCVRERLYVCMYVCVKRECEYKRE